MSTRFIELEGNSGKFMALIGVLSLLVAAGLYAAHYMERSGHHVTGMSNQVVWGIPHVFAVFLIIAASGALNVASMASVFAREIYKPLARLSVLVTVALLVGGLSILVLDLGRPDRLIVAMTHYNFKSIFAWNVFLYTGLLAVATVYLWTLMEGRMNRYSRALGTLAFIWRLVLTTGTGCIFGFLVARPAYNAAFMAPLFIAMSLALGLSMFVLISFSVFRFMGRQPDAELIPRFSRLLSLFIWCVLYLVVVQHVSNLYATAHHGVERFLLVDGGVYTVVFWCGQIGLGTIIPLVLLRRSTVSTKPRLTAAALVVVLGGLAHLYVLIIGYQAFPLTLFANKVVIESSFFDGVVAHYSPSIPEFTLSMGGVGIALLIVCVGLRVLRLLPDAVCDAPKTGKQPA